MAEDTVQRNTEKYDGKCMQYGLGSFAAFIIFVFAMPLRSAFTSLTGISLGDRIGPFVNLAIMAIAVVLGITALVFGFKALKHGERTWKLWLGMVPAFVSVALPLVLIVAEVAEIIRSAITDEPMRY